MDLLVDQVSIDLRASRSQEGQGTERGSHVDLDAIRWIWMEGTMINNEAQRRVDESLAKKKEKKEERLRVLVRKIMRVLMDHPGSFTKEELTDVFGTDEGLRRLDEVTAEMHLRPSFDAREHGGSKEKKR